MTSIEERFGGGPPPQTLIEWVENPPLILDGKPFSFHKHEYLRTPYEDNHPDQTWEKSTQMGCSTLAILKAIYGLRFLGFTGVLYCFPSLGHASDFSRSRIGPLIESNPGIAKWMKETDAINIKNIWNNFLFLRGMKSRGGLKTLPASFVIFDEWNEAEKPYEAMALAKERLAHSEHKWILRLSNPTLPDFAISKEFQLTDQRYWLLKCPACGRYTNMVESFPDCLVETKGEVVRGCKCGGILDPAKGEWVAKCPSIKDRRGYQYSQLWSAFVSPRSVLEEFRTTNNLTEFYNLKIGIGHVQATHRLTREEVLKLCGSEENASQDSGPCSCGIDQGADLHVVIGKRHPGKAGQIIHIGIYKDWQDLDVLMKRFGVVKCVCDGLPNQHSGRAFADRHKGKVYLSFYRAHRKGRYAWNERDLTVEVDRTESLDASHNELLHGQVILPRQCDLMETFADHCHATAKKLEEDETTGSKRYIYVKLGVDHFRHAGNLECISRGSMRGGYFGDSDLS